MATLNRRPTWNGSSSETMIMFCIFIGGQGKRVGISFLGPINQVKKFSLAQEDRWEYFLGTTKRVGIFFGPRKQVGSLADKK